jgi:hypothetical protein
MSTKPSHGYISYYAAVRDGERWPSVVYRVCGMASPTDIVHALLQADGTWFHLPLPVTYAVRVPPECSLTHAQLADAVERAGIVNVLPLAEPDRFIRGVLIVYDDRALRPSTTAREEWKPRAPRWRGGKAWV